jgi:hypothetical protein
LVAQFSILLFLMVSKTCNYSLPDDRNLRGCIFGQKAAQARIIGDFDGSLVRTEPAFPVKA